MRFQSTGKRLRFATPDRNTLLLGQPRVAMPRRPQLNSLPVLKNRGSGVPTLEWVRIDAPNNSNSWSEITFANGMFVATAINSGVSDNIMTSSDGVSWNARTNPTNSRLDGIAYGNGIWVIVSAGGGNWVTSTDGVTWTSRTPPMSAQSIAFDGSKFVVCGSGSSNCYTSTDGITWSGPTAIGFQVPYKLAFGNGLFVGGRSTNVATSPNGTSWTQRSVPNAGPIYYAPSYSPTLNRWVAIGYSGGIPPYVAYSLDGTNWLNGVEPTPSSGNWYASRAGKDIFVMTGGGNPRSAVSLDGINWRATNISRQTASWDGLAYGAGKFVAVSSSGNAGFGAISYSPY